jgi:hypothetical protein
METNEEPIDNVSELSRTYNLEINMPYSGGSSLLFRKEKLTILNNNVISKTQIDPIVKNYSNCARNVVTIFDPITGKNTTISMLALVAAIQRFGQ